VCIRCRPLNDKEKSQGHAKIVDVPKDRSDIWVNKPFVNEEPKQFTFDLTYGDEATQQQIYTETSSPIIANVLEGYNGTIFAYGQTGTGKTHTMTGLIEI
jgi:kinesin family protein 3/17